MRGAGVLVWLSIRYFDKLQKANEEITNIDLPSYGGVVAHSYLPSNWLAALGLFAWTRIDETLDSQELLDPEKTFTYVAPPGIDDTYVVFVIGETTRWDHMGMLATIATLRQSCPKRRIWWRSAASPVIPPPSCRCAVCLCAKAVLKESGPHAEREEHFCRAEGAGLFV